ncbi:MAG: ATP-dependent helicase [Candidatus Desulfaltia sp.]|nr:ATP-dependent helicase [Candidatus Desulfaltia sp.]
MSEITLTKEQKNVINFDGSLVAIAKPGSGKTTVLSRLIKRKLPDLPSHQGVIAISYTNKASDELKKRSTSGGIDIKASFFGTIDKFCDSEIIIPFLPHLWGRPEKEITVTKISDLSEDEQEAFSGITENTVSLDQLEEHLGAIRSWFKKGVLFLETNGALAQYTIENSPACQRYLKTRYTHIIVDEYQDSGLEQHELFLKLQSFGLTAIAVGDPDQSIFGFSNKDPKYLLNLPKKEEFTTFPITKNHRSHPSIINYSLRFLDERAELIETDETRMFHKHCAGNTASISAWIDARIPQLVEKYDVEKFSEISILVRGGGTGREINSSLLSKHRYFDTHPLENHLSLWAKIFAALLSYRYNDNDTAQDIVENSGTRISVSEVRKVKTQIRKVRGIADDELCEQLVEIAQALLPKAISEEAVRLLSESDPATLPEFFKAAEDEEIQIMSLHKAKGLEFDIVFHLDLHEWVLPAKRPGPGNDWDNPEYPTLEQDANLHYVGITRARKACFLCTADRRVNSYGEARQAQPSEFLSISKIGKLRIEI